MLKKFLKKAYNLCSEMMESWGAIFSSICFSSFYSAITIGSLKKRNHKEKCYILGNGPALNDALNDIKSSHDISLFAVNMMINTDAFFNLKPNNYIIADSGMWREENVLRSKGTKLYENLENAKRSFMNNLKKVDWDMNFFVPNDCPSKKFADTSPNVHIIRYNRTPVDGWRWLRHCLYSAGLGMPKPVNVVNAAIYCAILSGYKEIDLFGVNHSWMLDFRVDDQNRIYTKDTHFYKGEEERIFYKKGQLETSLRSMADAFKSHTMLNEFAQSKGIHIYNCTIHSFIDAYDFKKYED